MPVVSFVQADGSERSLTALSGLTVMEAAKRAGVEGIVAQCGGACACATCHVVVDRAWRAVVGPPSMEEEDMLQFASGVTEGSRLSCQIPLADRLDGLVVHVPRFGG